MLEANGIFSSSSKVNAHPSTAISFIYQLKLVYTWIAMIIIKIKLQYNKEYT
jgi:hypothetical protein